MECTAQVGKLKDARQQGSQGGYGCNVQLTLKTVARKKPPPKLPKVIGGVVFVFMQEERIRHTQTRTSAIRPDATKEAGGVQWYVLHRRKVKTDDRKTKRQLTQNARKEGGERTMLKKTINSSTGGERKK